MLRILKFDKLLLNFKESFLFQSKRNFNPEFIKCLIRVIFLSAGGILFHDPPKTFIGYLSCIKDQLHFNISSIL